MAQPQAYQQQHPQQNKGTLVAGQTIAVNRYTVQVERYLSQGGFAHVYLVRTAQPVYNTTHHVLKRVAVPNEAMLTEVKKEVDIMRILKGHPNIVHLIDAASHRMANGYYEVFILMEYCAGGGIIDMMNRRLRERLTETEILTIFVDVCEGLAAMHSLKPPLLHRDLKVENILQSSATSYKLCDFGSATPVQKVPNNMQELRALEADLNRHTTLQYRAPEMVDVYQRRPIDEKSDIWALGVLLYKLCYYTTPFEEHGPLAILNVQYKIPPYPVYSSHMNSLIASMLREHGAQRPTVFEVLNHVHALRGTKSRYTYNVTPSRPPVSPRAMQGTPLQTLSPNIVSPGATAINPLDDLVLFKSRSGQMPSTSHSPAKNAGVEAREKVLEAIAPMRRGRPGQSPAYAPSPPPSPKKEKDRNSHTFSADMKFGADEDRIWRGVRGHKSGMASLGGGNTVNLNSGGDAWGLGGRDARRGSENKLHIPKSGFDNDFSTSLAKGFGDSFDPIKPSTAAASPRPPPSPSSQPIMISRPTPSPRPAEPSDRLRNHNRDAFEGLGLSVSSPQQSLGDARRTRTGLASMTAPSAGQGDYTSKTPSSGIGSSTTTYRPPSSHSHFSYTPQPNSRTQSPAPETSFSRSQQRSSPASRPVLSVEERFPSLEDLDRTFSSSTESPAPPSMIPHVPTQPSSTERTQSKPSSAIPIPIKPLSRSTHVVARRTGNSQKGDDTLSSPSPMDSAKFDGARSQQVTGTAMRESRLGHTRNLTATSDGDDKARLSRALTHHSRPIQPRRHRSSLSIKQHTPTSNPNALGVSVTSSLQPPSLPPRPAAKPERKDWLTGGSDDEVQPSPPEPVLRASPSKRASYIERSPLQFDQPLEAVSVVPDLVALDITGEGKNDDARAKAREETRRTVDKHEDTTSVKRSSHIAARVSAKEQREPDEQRQRISKNRDGRQSPTKSAKASAIPTGTKSLRSTGTGHKFVLPPISSANSGLTDNWSPISSPKRMSRTLSASSDEGPEDVAGYKPNGLSGEINKADLTDDLEPRPQDDTPRRKHTRTTGRQSSVHDLVDLWGGQGPPPVERQPSRFDKRRSAILTSSSMMRSPTSTDHARTASPRPLLDAPVATPDLSHPSIVTPPELSEEPPVNKVSERGIRLPGLAQVSPAPSQTSGRTRPQSMFLNPVSKTAPLESHLSSHPEQQNTQQSDLRRRSTRRTSISDMVQRYEAIGSGKSAPPPVATKPVALAVKSISSESSGAGLPSPTTAATKFPTLSPTSSPVISQSKLAVPEVSEMRSQVSKQRRSPSPGFTNQPMRTPLGSTKPTENTPAVLNSTGARSGLDANKPLATSRPQDTQSSNASVPQRLAPPTTPSDELRAPSPERPYQGVSKLIDRWQRVVDNTETDSRGPPPKRVTVSGSLKGR